MSSSTGRSGLGQDYAPEYGRGYPPGERHGGAGAALGTVLAGILMMVSGAFGFLWGLAMVVRRGFFTNRAGYAYHWSTVSWGWLELAIGIVVFAAGVCVLFGMVWARVVGVVLATLSAVSAFLSLPLFPVWGIILVAINVFIIWALVSRSRDVIP